MNCPLCNTQMKPSFTEVYCPNDCDRKPQQKQEVKDYYALAPKGYLGKTIRDGKGTVYYSLTEAVKDASLWPSYQVYKLRLDSGEIEFSDFKSCLFNGTVTFIEQLT